MKVILWCLVSIGLMPCAWIALQWCAYRRLLALERLAPGAGEGYIHDRYISLQVGEWSLQMYPRPWAFALIAMGIMVIVASLVSLLHVPTR